MKAYGRRGAVFNKHLYIPDLSVSIGDSREKPADTEYNRLCRIKQHLINLTASKAFEDDEQTVSEEKAAYDVINSLWKDFYPNRNERFIAKRVSGDTSAGFDIFLESRADKPVSLDFLSSGEIEAPNPHGHIKGRNVSRSKNFNFGCELQRLSLVRICYPY
jgi:hypothetical protein